MNDDPLIVSVSGVRGMVGTSLPPAVAMAFGQAFGTMLYDQPSPAGRERRSVALGRDTRPTGGMVASAVIAGLTASGVDVTDLGVVTTPGAALMASRLGCDGGVVITSSHNPHPYNGIKFLQPTGPALPAEQANRLRAIWQAGEFRAAAGLDVGRVTADDSTHATHIEAVCSLADLDAIRSRRFKVVLDCVNGAGCIATPRLLEELGCEVIALNAEPTGLFAHTPEPIEANLTDLAAAVRDAGADVGFAQDPDADRLAIVDETGRFIGEEYTLALTAAFMLRHGKGPMAVNLSTSRMIDDIAEAAGVEVIRTPTGEANVAAAMTACNCLFGGEGNGGIIDPRVVLVRDSFSGMAMVLQDLAETGQTLAQRVAAIPAYHLAKTKLPCPAELAPTIAEKTRALYAGRDDVRFNEDDGLRIDLPDSWLSVRASNTEPIIRIFAEAPTAEQAGQLIAGVRAIAEDLIDG